MVLRSGAPHRKQCPPQGWREWVLTTDTPISPATGLKAGLGKERQVQWTPFLGCVTITQWIPILDHQAQVGRPGPLDDQGR